LPELLEPELHPFLPQEQPAMIMLASKLVARQSE
jgi:hypothetical protein